MEMKLIASGSKILHIARELKVTKNKLFENEQILKYEDLKQDGLYSNLGVFKTEAEASVFFSKENKRVRMIHLVRLKMKNQRDEQNAECPTFGFPICREKDVDITVGYRRVFDQQENWIQIVFTVFWNGKKEKDRADELYEFFMDKPVKFGKPVPRKITDNEKCKQLGLEDVYFGCKNQGAIDCSWFFSEKQATENLDPLLPYYLQKYSVGQERQKKIDALEVRKHVGELVFLTLKHAISNINP